MLEVCIEVLDSEAKFYRQLDMSVGYLGFEDALLPRLTADEPYAQLRPVKGQVTDVRE